MKNFEFSFDKNVIRLVETSDIESDFMKNLYFYGYKFEDGIEGILRSEFVNYIKNNSDKENTEIFNFINDSVYKLDKKIRLCDFNMIIYPESRSELIRNIMNVVYDYTSPKFKTIELIKNSINDIYFDNEAYSTHLAKFKMNRQDRKILDGIIQKIIEDIKNYDYFSIANAVKKPKYRKYFRNFLIFKNKEDELLFKQIENSNILIIDDINTSGSTIKECLRVLNKINPDSKKVIFTLIGGETHKM